VAGDLSRHGHREFRTRSHGEALFAFFETDMAASRGSRAIYILDEPEAALSPTRQMAFLRLIRDWEATKNIQVIVSTHSPIIMSYPGSSLFFLKCNEEIEEKRFIDTDHFKIYHRFIIDHEYMIKKIFAEK
jgi:predicted ATPase